jgi:hypothetical protein
LEVGKIPISVEIYKKNGELILTTSRCWRSISREGETSCTAGQRETEKPQYGNDVVPTSVGNRGEEQMRNRGKRNGRRCSWDCCLSIPQYIHALMRG